MMTTILVLVFIAFMYWVEWLTEPKRHHTKRVPFEPLQHGETIHHLRDFHWPHK